MVLKSYHIWYNIADIFHEMSSLKYLKNTKNILQSAAVAGVKIAYESLEKKSFFFLIF